MLRRPESWLARTTAALVVVASGVVAQPSASQVPPDARCELRGELGLTALRTIVRGRLVVDALEPRPLVAIPAGRSLHRIESIEREHLGETRERLPVALRVGRQVGAVAVHPGSAAAITRTNRADAVVDVALGGGVQLRRLRVPCADLELSLAHRDTIMRHVAGPHVVSRVPRIHLRSAPSLESETVLLERDDDAQAMVDLGRRDGFVHVHWPLPSAVVDGWIAATDVVDTVVHHTH